MVRPFVGGNDPGCANVPGRVRSVQPAPSTRPRVRWGIGDFLIAFVVGAVVGGVAGGLVQHGTTLTPTVLVVSLVAQESATIAYLMWASRAKGLGSLRADFGLTVRLEDIGWFFGGLGLQLAALIPTALLVAVHGHAAKQEVVKSAEQAHGIAIPFIVLGVGVLAPLTEELLFRGALLRSMLRRMSPALAVFWSAVVFGLVHEIGDPSVGTLVAFPVIVVLGVVSAYQAVRTGDLSRSVMLHVGFNSLTVLLLFL
jgi:uncharacterized protein